MSNTVKGFQTLQGIVQYDYESLKNKPDIDRKIQEAFEDAALPNPHKLIFTGAVQAEYDGSEEVTVDIPQGGGGGNVDQAQIEQAVADYLEKNPIEGGTPGADGEDGISPFATVSQTDSGAVITITDAYGTTTATVTNGKDGADGAKGDKGDKGDTGATGAKGDKGDKGDPGEQGEPGQDGADGAPGADGKDGVSATHSWNGTVLTVTSASGSSSADLKGAKGDKGDKGDTGSKGDTGEKGDTGASGKDGFSPTVAVSAIANGHRVTITDANRATSFDVYNGDTGEQGVPGEQGEQGKPGKSAYQYALDGGYTGTEEEFTELLLASVVSGGVPDMSENNPARPGYIKNRTHWKEVTQPEFNYETFISFSNTMSGISGLGTDNIIVGKTYTVTWNVTKYECTAILNGSVMLGNLSLLGLGDDTGEPFCLEMLTGSTALAYKSTEAAEDIYVTVYLPETATFHKIDNKYLDLDWLPVSEEFSATILSKREVNCSKVTHGDISYYCVVTCNFDVPLVAGRRYKVLWDGSYYDCVCTAGVESGREVFYLGNHALSGFSGDAADTGEPFFFQLNPAGKVYHCAATTQGVHTTEIVENEAVTHKMPGKFLPDGLPYSEGGGMAEILPECQPTYIPDEEMFALEFASSLSNLVAGETYIVNWNGTEYPSVAVDGAEHGEPGIMGLGDLYTASGGEIGTASTGEPFMMTVNPREGVMILPFDGTTELTLSIYQSGEIVHKLDNKYLDLDWLPVMEKVKATILPIGEFDCSVSNGTGYFKYMTNAELSLVAGRKYKVFWDGSYYACVCAELYNEDAGIAMYFLGNQGIMDTGSADAGQPFCFYSIPSGPMLQIHAKTQGVHTAAIVENDVAPNKLPKHFLPDSVGFVTANIVISSSLNSATVDVPYAALVAAHKAGKFIRGVATVEDSSDNAEFVFYLNGLDAEKVGLADLGSTMNLYIYADGTVSLIAGQN